MSITLVSTLGLLAAHNKTTKLAVLFALVGAMMVVIPMLIEQAQAFTVGIAKYVNHRFNLHFTKVEFQLDRGFWVHKPKVTGGTVIDWETRGRSGPERGTVGADLAFSDGHVIGHATFFFSNPVVFKNSCDTFVSSTRSTDLRVTISPCHITGGNVATANYQVGVRQID